VLLRRLWVAGAFLLPVLVLQPAGAQRYAVPPDYPHSLQRDLEALRTAGAHRSSDPGLLIRLAEVYRHLGDDLLEDPEEQRAAYEEGARIARRALELEETNAEAHFLYAANIGSAARTQGLFGAIGTLQEIKTHLARAIELQPNHAPSLGFMGGLLADLPAFLGGDEMASRRYLERAVAADGSYTIARIVLARILIRQDRVEAARQQLRAVIEAERPRYPYTWKRKLRPEAEELLRAIEVNRSTP
jgi:tetratricopeptide (TPR) repeat protein